MSYTVLYFVCLVDNQTLAFHGLCVGEDFISAIKIAN